MVVLNPRTATALLGIAVASTQAAALPQYGRMRTGTIQHSSSYAPSDNIRSVNSWSSSIKRHDHDHDHTHGHDHDHDHDHSKRGHDHDHDHDHSHGHDHDHKRSLPDRLHPKDIKASWRLKNLGGGKVGISTRGDHVHEHGGHDHEHIHIHHHKRTFTTDHLGAIYIGKSAGEDDSLSVHVLKRGDGLLGGLLGPLLAPLDPLLGTVGGLLQGLPLVPGVLNIIGPLVNGLIGDQLGGLILGTPTPAAASKETFATFVTNSTNGTSTADAEITTFPLSLSNSTKTQMYLVRADADPNTAAAAAAVAGNLTSANSNPNSTLSNSNSTTGEIAVTFRIPVFLAQTASVVAYCATYDSNPPVPAPLTAQPCMTNSSSPQQASSNSSASQGSQLFAYNPVTGVIRPMWNSQLLSPATNSSSAQLASANAQGSTNGTMDGTSVTLMFQPLITSASLANTTGASANVTGANAGMNVTSADDAPPDDGTPPMTMSSDDGSSMTMTMTMTMTDDGSAPTPMA